MAQIRVKELRFVHPAELAADERNWREHPEAQRKALQAMVDSVGVVDALIARETPDGLVLIDGHLRRDMLAEQELPVIIVDLDEDEAGQVLATLDPIAAMAQTNQDALQALVDATKPPIDWPRVMSRVGIPDAGQDDVAEPEDEAEPETSRGDVWILGKHRLMCGDATDPEDVARLLGGAEPRLMVTDPPYGVSYDADWRNRKPVGGLFGPHADYPSRAGKVTGDDEAYWLEALQLAPSAVAYVWSASLTSPESYLAVESAGFQVRNQIIWRKRHFIISRGHYHWQHEVCWYGVKPGQGAGWRGDRRQSTLWDIQTRIGAIGEEVDFTDHSVVKPVECMERPLRNHDGDVYDPFVGSGTTIIAAERQARTCYAMEIEPRYVDVARKRWEAYTGNTAVLEQADG